MKLTRFKSINVRALSIAVAASISLSSVALPAFAEEEGIYIDCQSVTSADVYCKGTITDVTDGIALSDFKTMLDEADADSAIMCNFENTESIPADTSSINLKCGDGESDYITVTQSADGEASAFLSNGGAVQPEPTGYYTSGVRMFTMLSGPQKYTLTFSSGKDQDNYIRIVKALGFAVTGKNVPEVKVVAYYKRSDNGKLSETKEITYPGASGRSSAFFGFEEREDEGVFNYISKIDIYPNGKTISIDDLCLITEKIDTTGTLAGVGIYSKGTITNANGIIPLGDFDSAEDGTFWNMLQNTDESDTIIYNFEKTGVTKPEKGKKDTYVSSIDVACGYDNNNASDTVDYITVTQSAECEKESDRLYYGAFYPNGGTTQSNPTGYYTSGNSMFSMLATPTKYTLTFSPSGEDESYIRIAEAMGIAFTGNNIQDLKVTAYYKSAAGDAESNSGEIGHLSGSGRKSVFYGFKAPDGYYISKIEINPNGKTISIDDLCLLTTQIDKSESEISKLEITGDSEVVTPPFRSVLSYNYGVKVFDQFGLECDETVAFTLTEYLGGIEVEYGAVEFENGKLTITQQNNMPDSVKISALVEVKPSVTAEYNVTLDITPPFYDGDKIGIQNGNDEYVLSDFVNDMEAAMADPDMDVTMINFENPNEEVFVDRINVPLAKRDDIIFNCQFTSKKIDFSESKDGMLQGTDKQRPLEPSSGSHVVILNPLITAENDYLFDTVNLGDFRVSAFGFVYLGCGNAASVEDGFRIDAYFSDGTIKTYGKDQAKDGTVENNTFYGIKAPLGHYITRIYIEMPPRVWSRMDDMGFIFEKADILYLKKDYENFLFSSFCNQDMRNISADIALPTMTASGCSVSWTATNKAGETSTVINTTPGENLGKFTIPEKPEESEIVLAGTLTCGDVSKTRYFNLYAPSKPELDVKALNIPEITRSDIKVSGTGSVYGSIITCFSENENLISNTGKVTRPAGKDKYCVIEVTAVNGTGTYKKEIGITVEGTDRDITTGSGSGGGGGGGGIVASTPTVAVPKEPVEIKTEKNRGFKDVPREHWAYESIAELTEKGIVNGMDDVTFNPEGTVTREQYLSMLVRALGFTDENASAEFSDVEKDSWYFDAVSVAQSLGICSGYEDGSFGIGKEITREEMAVMAYRSALLAKLGIETTDEKTTWKDSGEISHFAYDAVAALNNAGIIKGVSEDKFSPKTTTTRAQAAVIIQRLLSVQ